MKQHKGKDLRRVNLTIPDDVFRWLKIQAAKADMSISLYLTKLIEKEKKFFDLSEKS
jgi:predicted CopG family antitoxin